MKKVIRTFKKRKNIFLMVFLAVCGDACDAPVISSGHHTDSDREVQV